MATGRSFCYVRDMVDAFVRLMAAETDPGPVNLGNPSERTVEDLADNVLDLTRADSNVLLE
jgi:nucleoside-diphosphate-sugar epimerase